MNFIVDENVSLAVVRRLRKQGYDVIAISEGAYSGLNDQQIFSLAVEKKSILITRDEHFSNPIRFPIGQTKGIFIIRPGNIKSDEEASLVERFVKGHNIEELTGCLITLYRDKITVLSPERKTETVANKSGYIC